MIRRSQWPEAPSHAGSTNLQVGKATRREERRKRISRYYLEGEENPSGGILDQQRRRAARISGPKCQTCKSTLRTQ